MNEDSKHKIEGVWRVVRNLENELTQKNEES